MQDNNFNPNHPRAKKAILKRHHAKIFVLSIFIATLLVVAGTILLATRNSAGWLVSSLSAPFIMLAFWTEMELKHLPLGPSENINDLLTADLLVLLRKHRSAQSLAEPLLTETVSGRFLMVRFGLFPELLDFLSKGQRTDLAPLFQRARRLRTLTDSKQISGAVLALAIVESHPEYQELLRRYQLDFDDLVAGVVWYNYLHRMSKDFKHRIRNGGIARDLNFGYIPNLQHFGFNISDHLSRSARSQINRTARKEVLEKMLQIFSSNARQNVALIGPEGSGKTILVNAFAACLNDDSLRLPSKLRYRQVFKLDASALIAAAGATRGNLEGLLNSLFNEAYAAKNIILYLNNAQLFFTDGTGSVDLSNLLQPIIEAGRLRIIMSFNEQDFLRVQDRAFANSLNRIFVRPTDEKDTMKVMEDQVPYFESRFGVVYDYRALKEAYRLGLRYLADRAMPGRALRLLELGAEYAEHSLVTPESIQRAVEENLGVKVQVANTSEDRGRLLSLEESIHKRLIGQTSAVHAVASALRRSAAGVRNEHRPIGAFLFLGPTGVGKTELAKAISEVYFDGEEKIIRLDLNEFISKDSINRLLASPDEDAGSLTAQISKHPFSVVLLDEIEKAHPAVLTALLQMLDEGVLRDSKGQEINFRDAIIVATSNARANEIRDFIMSGVPLSEVKDKINDQLIRSGDFKPEFLNRFDEICIFEPLRPEQLAEIVDIIMRQVNSTLAPQKIRVDLDPSAKSLLVKKGYDPVLGARPLRRLVQRSVENFVAKAILSGSATTGSTLRLTARELEDELGA